MIRASPSFIIIQLLCLAFDTVCLLMPTTQCIVYICENNMLIYLNHKSPTGGGIAIFQPKYFRITLSDQFYCFSFIKSLMFSYIIHILIYAFVHLPEICVFSSINKNLATQCVQIFTLLYNYLLWSCDPSIEF